MTSAVVIPAFNGARYIERAINSVLAQTLPAARIVVIDDGSRDDTSDIVASFSSRGVGLVRQQNAGVAAARNRGLTLLEPSIQYVLFLDQDDELLPTALATLSAQLNAHPAWAVCFGQALAIDSDGRDLNAGNLHRPYREYYGHGRLEWRRNVGQIFPVDICSSTCMSTPGQALIRRSVLQAVGGFNTWCVPSDDVNLWLEMTMLAQIWGVPDVVLRYRCHSQNTGKNTAKLRKAGLRMRLHWLRTVPWPLKAEVLKAYFARIIDRGLLRIFHSPRYPAPVTASS